MVMATVLVMVLTTLAAGALVMSSSGKELTESSLDRTRSLYGAEAAVADARTAILGALAQDSEPPTSIGSSRDPIQTGGGQYVEPR